MRGGNKHLIEAAKKLELYAFWETDEAPDGICATLVYMPEDENEPGVLAAVRVRDEETAWKLQELLEERALEPAGWR